MSTTLSHQPGRPSNSAPNRRIALRILRTAALVLLWLGALIAFLLLAQESKPWTYVTIVWTYLIPICAGLFAMRESVITAFRNLPSRFARLSWSDRLALLIGTGLTYVPLRDRLQIQGAWPILGAALLVILGLMAVTKATDIDAALSREEPSNNFDRVMSAFLSMTRSPSAMCTLYVLGLAYLFAIPSDWPAWSLTASVILTMIAYSVFGKLWPPKP